MIVKRLRSNSMEIYVKGAPEVMADICFRDSCMFLSLLSASMPLTFAFDSPA